MTKISIIITVYNSEKYIEKCLKSIKEQTLKDFEVIIINDGSKDKTKNKIEKFLDDKRFKLYNRKNHGIGASRNFGIKKVKSDYVMFLDSDDYIEKDTLEVLYNKITKDNLDIVVCDYYEEQYENKIKKEVKIKDFKNTTLNNNPNLLLYINKSPWNKLFKYELIKDIEYPSNLKYEDSVFVCLSLKNANIGKVNKCLNHYIIHGNSETTTMDKRVYDILTIVDNIRKDYDKEDNVIKEYIDEMTLQMLTTYTVQQRYQKDKNIRNDFIDKVFDYLSEHIPNYKNNNYFKSRKIKGIIEKNKVLTKIYCNFYTVFHRKKMN